MNSLSSRSSLTLLLLTLLFTSAGHANATTAAANAPASISLPVLSVKLNLDPSEEELGGDVSITIQAQAPLQLAAAKALQDLIDRETGSADSAVPKYFGQAIAIRNISNLAHAKYSFRFSQAHGQDPFQHLKNCFALWHQEGNSEDLMTAVAIKGYADPESREAEKEVLADKASEFAAFATKNESRCDSVQLVTSASQPLWYQLEVIGFKNYWTWKATQTDTIPKEFEAYDIFGRRAL